MNLLVTSEIVQRQIREVMTKYAAQPGIYLDELGRIQVVIPPRSDQEEIVRQVKTSISAIESKIRLVRRELDCITEYRTRLIVDVVTGKLDVRGLALPEIKDAEEVETLSESDEEEAENNTELVGAGEADDAAD